MMSERNNKLLTEKDLNFILPLSMLPVEKKFNIFNLNRISNDELFSSDVWAYFLNPDEQHRMKTIFLEALFKLILKDEYNNEFSQKLRNIKVSREVVTNAISKSEDSKLGRIDIEIVGDFGVLIIENKINSGDENNPWGSYYSRAKRDLTDLRIESGKIYAGFLTKYALDPKNEEFERIKSLECTDFKLTYRQVLEQVEKIIKEQYDVANFENRSLELFRQFLEFSGRRRRSMDIRKGIHVCDVFKSDIKVANENIKELDRSIDAWLDELINKIKDRYGNKAESILGSAWGTSWGNGNSNNELIVGKEPYAHWIFRGNNTNEMTYKDDSGNFSIEFYYVRSWGEKESEDTNGSVYYKFWSGEKQKGIKPKKLADFSEDIDEVADKAVSKIEEIRERKC